jgi:hypothetical protein
MDFDANSNKLSDFVTLDCGFHESRIGTGNHKVCKSMYFNMTLDALADFDLKINV